LSQGIASSALIAGSESKPGLQPPPSQATTIAVNNCRSDSTLRKLHVAQCTTGQQQQHSSYQGVRTYEHSPSRLVNTKLQKKKEKNTMEKTVEMGR